MARTWITKVNNVDTVDAAHVNDLQTYKLDKDELPWVRPEDYGAVGDGVHDDKAAIQAAVNSAEAVGGVVLFSDKTYLIDSDTVPTPESPAVGNDDGVIISHSITLRGTGNNSVLKQSDNSRYILLIRHSLYSEVEGVTLDGLCFDGPTTRQSPYTHVEHELQHQVAALHVKNLTVKDCTFRAMQGSGLAVGINQWGAIDVPSNRNNENINILNNLFDGVDNLQAGGILMGDGTNVLIQGNTFKNIAATNEPGSIDIELDPGSGPYAMVKNFNIVDNKFYDCNTDGNHIRLYIATGTTSEAPKGFRVSGNSFHGTGNGICFQLFDDQDIGISVEGNQYFGTGAALFFGYSGVAPQYLNDIIVNGNIFDSSLATVPAVFMGIKWAHEDIIKRLTFTNNIVIGNSSGANYPPESTASTIMTLGGSIEDVKIIGNIFNSGHDTGLLIGLSGATTAKNVTIKDNRFTNIGGAGEAVTFLGSDTANRPSRVIMDNVLDAGMYLQFPGYRTDLSTHSTVGAYYPVYDYTILPDSFPCGRSVSVVDSVTGLTTNGGTLITEKHSSEAALRNTVIQWFREENADATSLRKIYFRKGVADSNTWSSWQTIMLHGVSLGDIDLGTGTLLTTDTGFMETRLKKTGLEMKNIYADWINRNIATYVDEDDVVYFRFGGLWNGQALVNAFIGPAYDSPWITFLPSGNVGINDDAPAEKLDINGNINTTGVVKVDDVQVVGAQAASQADLKADYTTLDLDTEAEIIAAINATNAGFNTLLAKLRTHGLIDT